MCVITIPEALETDPGQADRERPVQDRHFRLTHILDKRFRTTTCTYNQIPELRRISPQTVINHLRLAGLLARRHVRRNVPTAHRIAESIRWC